MLPGTRIASAVALLAAVITLAACGSEGFEGDLSQDQARALLEQVDDVEQAFESRECTTAETDAKQLLDEINGLPAEVGTELKEALREATERLRALVEDECEEPAAAPEAEAVEPTEPEVEETTAPPETETDPETEIDPETEEPPEDGEDDGPGRGAGQGEGQGGGNGNGPGGGAGPPED